MDERSKFVIVCNTVQRDQMKIKIDENYQSCHFSTNYKCISAICSITNFCKKRTKQECIPVGCVPPADWPSGVSLLGGMPPCWGGVMWPISSCIWCYQYAASTPTECQHLCSSLYSVTQVHAGIPTPPPEQNDKQVQKYYLAPNAGGNEWISIFNVNLSGFFRCNLLDTKLTISTTTCEWQLFRFKFTSPNFKITNDSLQFSNCNC